MTKNRIAKKVTSIGLALAVVMGMSATSFAATGITSQQALDKALDNAKLSESQVRVMELEADGGKYEIEFISLNSGNVYSYEISKLGSMMEKSVEYSKVDPAGAAKITEAQAVQVALDHEGFTKSQVTDLRSGMDDGNYEVEYVKISNGNFYEYEISKVGTIRERTIEYGKISVPTEKKSTFTKSQAVAKALKDAGTTKTKVKYLESSLDDGKYEVEFTKKSNRAEYSYEYSKKGTLLEKSVDYRVAKKTGSSNLISKSKAKAKVRSFGGFKSSTLKNAKVIKDRDNGQYVYEVKFNTSNWHYEYEVQAKTGKILEYSKERR